MSIQDKTNTEYVGFNISSHQKEALFLLARHTKVSATKILIAALNQYIPSDYMDMAVKLMPRKDLQNG